MFYKHSMSKPHLSLVIILIFYRKDEDEETLDEEEKMQLEIAINASLK